MRFVILDGFLPGLEGRTLEIAPHEQVWYPETPPEKATERIGTAEGILVNRFPVTEELLEKCPGIRYIGTFSTGCNMIDLNAAAKRGIVVCNVPGYSTQAVAQHTFALLLEIVNNISALNRFVHDGSWSRDGYRDIQTMPLMELSGRTLGICGAGSIGQQVARLGEVFGMKVVAYRRHPERDRDALTYVDLDTLLAVSDVVSIHLPLTEETRGMFSTELLSRMKDGAILLNTSRGAVLDEAAVVRALDSGKLYAVGADVLCQEPPETECRLASHPRAVVTPHVGWLARETQERLLKLVAGNIMAYAAGHPQNRVI